MAKKVRRRPTIETITDGTPAAPSTNKSQAIRDYLAQHPDAKPKAVTEALAAGGLVVSPNMVSLVKTKLHAKGAAKKATAKPTEDGATEQPSSIAALWTLYRAAKGKAVPRNQIDSAFMLLASQME